MTNKKRPETLAAEIAAASAPHAHLDFLIGVNC